MPGIPARGRDDAIFQGGTQFREVGDFVRENYQDFAYAKGANQEAKFAREALGLPKGAWLLDVACGTGRHAQTLGKVYRVVGVDLTRGLLTVARNVALRSGLEFDQVQGDARALPVKPVFDGAMSFCEGAFGLLGSDEEHVRMLTSVRAALKPRGRFLLSAMNAFVMNESDSFDALSSTMMDPNPVVSPDGRTRTFLVPTRAFAPRELRTLAERAGFEIEQVYGGITGGYRLRPFKHLEDAEMLFLLRNPA